MLNSKPISKFMAVILSIAISIGMTPVTAFAEGDNDIPPVVSGVASPGTTAALASTISGWVHGGTGTLEVATSGNTVTVTGTVTNATAMLDTVLTIDADVNLVWKANLTIDSSYPSSTKPFITAAGSGTFEMAAGGKISGSVETTSTLPRSYAPVIELKDSVTLDVTGGTVQNTYNKSSASNANLTRTVILKDASKLNMTNGTIGGNCGITINIEGTGNAVDISGGTVSNGQFVIYAGNDNPCNIIITGGTIRSTGNANPISAITGKVFAVSGTLRGYGTSDIDAINTSLTGSGLAVVWDKTGNPGPLNNGAATGLTVMPTGATVTWGEQSGVSGIRYNIGGNAGFIAVPGVDVKTVSETPEISDDLSPTKAAATGDNVALTVTASAPDGGTLSYEWYKGTNKLSETSNTLTIASATLADSGSYKVVVTNTNGQLSPATATSTVCVLTVSPAAPTVSATPTISVDLSAAKSATVGDEVNLTVTASASDGGTLSYAWTKDGSPLSETTDTLTIASAALADSGSYKVVVTNTNGQLSPATKDSTVCVLTVSEPASTDSATPTIGVDLPAAKAATAGDSIVLTVTASASDGGALTYEWYKGTDKLSETTNTLTINNAQTTDSGSYKVVVKNTKDALTPATKDSTVCVLTVSEPAPPITYFTVNFNANGGSVSASSMQSGADGKLSGLPTPTRSSYTFNGWFTAASGGTQITTSTVFTANTTVYAHWTYNGGSSSSSGGSSGGGGGGGSTTTTTTTTTNTSSNVSSNGSVSSTAIQSEASTVLKSTGNTATLQTKNAESISASTIKSLAKAANDAGKDLKVHADTMGADGRSVVGRLYVEPSKLTGLTGDLKLGVSTSVEKTGAIKNNFEKWFDNKVVVVKCEHQGSFGAKLEIAAKVDLTKLNTKNLVFYSYNKATNSYTQIADTGYFVDKNGYIHFNTTIADYIIITDKPLVKK